MQYVNVGRTQPDYKQMVYGTFLGLDLSSAPRDVSESRSPDMLNMVIEEGVPKKRKGWAVLRDFGGTVLGLHRVPGALIVHRGTDLIAYPFEEGEAVGVPEFDSAVSYAVGDCVNYQGSVYKCTAAHSGAWSASDFAADSTPGIIYAGMNSANRSSGFYMNGSLFLLDGKRYSKITKAGTVYTASPVSADAYVPTTGINGYYDYTVEPAMWTPCVPDQEKNLLTTSQKNLLCGDAENTEFWLTERACTVDTVELLNGTTMEWEATSAYTASEDTDMLKTKITFTTAPDIHPDGAGLNNIRVTFHRTDDAGSAEQINGCTLAATFGYFNDNRVFLSGNSAYPNRDWASGIDDPSYIEENGWANIGSDAAAIIGYLHYGDTLAIMKEDNNTDAEIYIRSGYRQEDGRIMFPVQQGVKGVGAVSKGCFANLRDDALFLAREGVYAIVGTDASQQKTVQNRSRFIDPALASEAEKENACMTVWEDRLLLCFPGTGHVYVADARMKTGSSDTESYGYEWVRWSNIRAAFFHNEDGTLYFVTGDGKLCRFTNGYADGGEPIQAYWCTKEQDFGYPGMFKTLLERGTHVIAETGRRVKLTAVTENGETVLLDKTPQANGIRALAAVKGAKKFRTLKLRVENAEPDEGLTLEGISLMYTYKHWVK